MTEIPLSKLGGIQHAKPGDEIAIVEMRNGKLIVSNWYYMATHRVMTEKGATSIDPTVLVTCHNSWDRDTGKMRPGMYPNPYYMSADPRHVAKAKRQNEAARKERQKQEKAKVAKLKAFMSELEELLTKYGAEITPVQLSGDDQGVELSVEYSVSP